MFQRNKDRLLRLLHWIERYTKVDMVYLASGGFWLTVGQVSSTISVFALGLVFANLLPKETYGTYKYFLSLAGLFSIFTLPGISTSLARATARGFGGSLMRATWVRLRWSLWGAGFGLCGALYYAFAGNMTLAIGLVIIAFFLPVLDTFSNYGPYLQGKQDFRTYTLLGALVQIIAVTAIILSVFFTKNLTIILITYFASYALLRFLALRYVEKRYPPQGAVDPEMISYGKHLTVMGVLGQIAGQADTLLIFHFLGPVQVALYTVAIAAPDQIKNITGSVSDLLFPRLASYSEETVRKKLLSKAFLLLSVMMVIIILYIIIAPILYRIFFPAYHDSIFLSQLFVLSMVNALFSPFAIFLQAHRKVRELYVTNTATSILQIVAMAIGVIWFGLIGLIAGRIVSRILGGSLNMIFFYFPLTKPSLPYEK